jgi:hypothetical protein
MGVKTTQTRVPAFRPLSRAFDPPGQQTLGEEKNE